MDKSLKDKNKYIINVILRLFATINLVVAGNIINSEPIKASVFLIVGYLILIYKDWRLTRK